MKKSIRLISLLTMLVLILSINSFAFAESSGNPKVADARNGVVRIVSFFDGSMSGQISLGTAFAVSGKDGGPTVFATNWHCVVSENYLGSYQKASRIYILLDDRALINKYDALTDITELVMDDTRVLPCDILYCDMDEDLYSKVDMAILQTKQPVQDREILTLSDFSQLKAADNVFALGYPGSMDIISTKRQGQQIEQEMVAEPEKCMVTGGIVSRIGEYGAYGDMKIILHDAQIDKGNSGGPLVNSNGEVLGINTYGLKNDDGTKNSYVTISIDYVKEALDKIGVSYTTAKGSSEKPLIELPTASAAAVSTTTAETKQATPTASAAAVSTTTAETKQATPIWVWIAAAAAVVVIVVLVVVLTVKAKKKKKVAAAAEVPSISVTMPGREWQPEQLRIQGSAGFFMGKRYPVKDIIRIGRDPSKNSLIFPADTKGVSGVHCVVSAKGDKLELVDLGSTYGTYLGTGAKLNPNQTYTLSVGDKFCLGTQDQEFTVTNKGGVM